MPLKLSSQAFRDGEEIPKQFTGEGADRSPPLKWSGVPQETREFVLVCEDPDAPQDEPFVHWLIYDISPSISSLPEGMPAKERMELPVRADQGRNSFGNIGYGGPMPPEGHGRHRYFFRLYALNFELGVQPGATKEELLKALQPHIIDQAVLMGTYERKIAKKTA